MEVDTQMRVDARTLNSNTSGRIRLRRKPYEVDEQALEQNLHKLEENSMPKRMAQDMYYNSNVSPMKLHNKNRLPVQARLGKRLRRGAFMYPHNNNTMFRPRRFLRSDNRNIAQLRMQNLRSYLNQTRYNRIMLQRNRNSIPPLMSQRTNYMVQFNSSPFNVPSMRHSCLKELNKKLQEEIKLIEKDSEHPPEVIAPVPIITIGYGCTAVTMNDRFSQ